MFMDINAMGEKVDVRTIVIPAVRNVREILLGVIAKIIVTAPVVIVWLGTVVGVIGMIAATAVVTNAGICLFGMPASQDIVERVVSIRSGRVVVRRRRANRGTRAAGVARLAVAGGRSPAPTAVIPGIKPATLRLAHLLLVHLTFHRQSQGFRLATRFPLLLQLPIFKTARWPKSTLLRATLRLPAFLRPLMTKLSIKPRQKEKGSAQPASAPG